MLKAFQFHFNLTRRHTLPSSSRFETSSSIIASNSGNPLPTTHGRVYTHMLPAIKKLHCINPTNVIAENSKNQSPITYNMALYPPIIHPGSKLSHPSSPPNPGSYFPLHGESIRTHVTHDQKSFTVSIHKRHRGKFPKNRSNITYNTALYPP